jgi:hypothetical protein
MAAVGSQTGCRCTASHRLSPTQVQRASSTRTRLIVLRCSTGALTGVPTGMMLKVPHAGFAPSGSSETWWPPWTTTGP